MGGVNRWKIRGMLPIPGGRPIYRPEVVLSSDFDELKRKHLRSCQIAIGKSQLAKERHAQLISAQSELAALREEVAKQGDDYCKRVDEVIDLQQRLTAAEQRNAELIKLLQHFANCADVRQVGTWSMNYVAALKPTESGASE